MARKLIVRRAFLAIVFTALAGTGALGTALEADCENSLLNLFRADLENLSKLRREIQRRGHNVQRVERVFYPMAGTDIATPLMLFPEAKIINLTDERPIFSGSMPSPLTAPKKPPIASAYRHINRIKEDGEMGPRILGTILAMGERAAILDIQGTPRGAEIKFDLGDGQGPRLLRYVQTDIGDPLELDRILQEANPQAIVIKGAMSALSAHQTYQGSRAAVLRALQKSNGILVEGLYSFSGQPDESRFVPEFSAPFPKEPLEQVWYPKSRSSVVSRDMPDFGYGPGLAVTTFAE